MDYVVVDSRVGQKFCALVNAEPVQVTAQADISGNYLSQVGGNQSGFSTRPVPHLPNDTMGRLAIAC